MQESYYLIVVNTRYYSKMVSSDYYRMGVGDIPAPAAMKPGIQKKAVSLLSNFQQLSHATIKAQESS
jgi:hypothetical protein